MSDEITIRPFHPRDRTAVRQICCDRAIIILRAIFLALLLGGAATAAPLPLSVLALNPSDRILILAPHPDDEVIGCGGIIQRSAAMNLPVRIVYFTYGDNNEWSFMVYRRRVVLFPNAVKKMGMIRHDEAVAAAAVLGVQTNQLTFLGYPDFSTLDLWLNHWGDAAPAKGMMTHASAVPYSNALRPGAPFKGEEVVKDLTRVIREFKPTKIFVSHPSDFNVDHRALYCFTRLTLWNLESEMTPEIFPYMVHFPRWPNPRGHHPEQPLQPPSFFTDDIVWQTFGLPPDYLMRKGKAIRAHLTQFEYARKYLDSFVRASELFGDFQTIVLQPPDPLRHVLAPTEGTRHYEGDEEGELTESERNGFVGVEWRHVQLETNMFKVSIDLSRPLAEAVSAAIQVFGYRHDTPFEAMPKIRIEVGALRHTVHNQHKNLPGHAVQVSRHAKEIEAEIPLELLGRPERLFVCARTYLGDIPLDWVSWRIVEIK
ncbi:MAG: PIG-L family deacetylase [bacterium]